jgi:siroheme synthase-like protein
VIISLLLNGRKIAVVGSGIERHRRIVAAAAENAEIVAFGSEHCRECEKMLKWRKSGMPSGSDLADAQVVIAVDRNKAMNRLLATYARRFGFLLNTVDEPETCDFYHVSVREAHPGLLLAVSSSGAAPAFAKGLADRLLATITAEDRVVFEQLRSDRAAFKDNGVAPSGIDWPHRESTLRSLYRCSHRATSPSVPRASRPTHRLADFHKSKGALQA